METFKIYYVDSDDDTDLEKQNERDCVICGEPGKFKEL